MPEIANYVLLLSIKNYYMKFGICNLSLVAIRKSPDHCSEIVTQLIFGETLKLSKKKILGLTSKLIMMIIRVGYIIFNFLHLTNLNLKNTKANPKYLFPIQTQY